MVDMPVPMKHRTIIEPCRIKSVEPIGISTAAERREQLAHAHYNPFLLRSKDVIIDLMTDSGTSAMSAQQWAGMMEGDEAYAGSRSWERMELAVQELTTMANVLPTHQGRAAERIIYGHLGGPGKVFISNTHFDTTRANIEFTGATAIDIPIPEGRAQWRIERYTRHGPMSHALEREAKYASFDQPFFVAFTGDHQIAIW